MRRKDDLDFWLRMNPDFGVPYGPWGYGSGMGVEDVDRLEAEELGLVAPGETIQPPDRKLNDRLSAGIRDMDPPMVSELRRIFGDQVRVGDGKLEWTGSRSRPAPERTTSPGGIASMEQAKETFRNDYGTRMVLANPWGSYYGEPTSEVERIAHARRVASEMARLQARWPALHGKLRGFCNNRPKNALGWADVGSGDAHLISWLHDRLPRTWEQNLDSFEVAGAVYSAATVRRSSNLLREDIFRHELGHALTRHSDLSAWPLDADQSRALISFYAGENPSESIAEAFCVYTREDYRKGMLPDIVESFLERLLTR